MPQLFVFLSFFLFVSFFLRKPDGGAAFVAGPSPTQVVNRRQSAAGAGKCVGGGMGWDAEHVSSLAAMHAAVVAGLWELEGGAGAKICAATRGL